MSKNRNRQRKKKKKKLKRKSGRSTLIDQIKRDMDLSDEQIFSVGPSQGIEKMSEVVWDFVDPLIEHCQNDEQKKNCVTAAILAWNMSVSPKKLRNEVLNDLLRDYSEPDKSDFWAVLSFLMKRKKNEFFSNRRLIVNYQFSGSGKTLRLDVASTLPS